MSILDVVLTFDELTIPDPASAGLGRQLAKLVPPGGAVVAHCRRLLAQLPDGVLYGLLDFGRNDDAPGALLLRNLPAEASLPLLAEGVLLGFSSLLGRRVGVLNEALFNEKGGRQASAVFLDFHNDPSGPGLVMQRPAAGTASTYIADARDLALVLDDGTLECLRSPLYRWGCSEPAPVLGHGVPGIAFRGCGVRASTRAAEVAVARLQTACREVAHEVRVGPGEALLVNNRKGLYACSPFRTLI